jgi:uridine kinase
MKDRKTITVYVEGKKVTNVKEGLTAGDLAPLFGGNHIAPIIAAKINNRIVQLSEPLIDQCKVDFIDMDSGDGVRIYKRSLQFLLAFAMHKMMPHCKLKISHSVSNGVYCTVEGVKADEELASKLEAEMKRLVSLELPIEEVIVNKKEAVKILEKQGREDSIMVLDYLDEDKVTFYKCQDYYDSFFSSIVANTRYLKVFSIRYHEDGLVIVHPVRYDSSHVAVYNPSEKLFRVFTENKEWGKILELDTVGQLNKMAKNGEIHEMILVSEALQSKKINEIADEITRLGRKLVLISGPSSSGKTTFSRRLAIALRVNGIKSTTISLDNYYRDQSEAPIGEDGQIDLEHIDTLDLKLLNDQLSDILQYKEVEVPIFNFNTKKREPKGRMFRAEKNGVIIMEGIHALNKDLTKKIPDHMKYKVYVSALATINIDDHVRISTTDNRLIRRMVRDKQYRNTEAEETLMRWPSVRAVEKRWIFPYQEEADIMFNSALYYELSVLKNMAEPLLLQIGPDSPQYPIARRLLDLLDYFHPVKPDYIPNNSILREFIGGSCFHDVHEGFNTVVEV